MAQSSDLPKTIGRYEVTRVLGQGAMGRVLLARDPVLARDVAVKILRDDLGIPPEVRDGLIVRMRHEAQAAARVTHPNLVTLHDMGTDAEVGLFLVFEYVNGPNLKERLRSGRLPPQQAARLARELGQSLSIAHLSGVLHRDVKPENILLAPTGAKISDFGIARVPDSTLTRTGSLIGTPAYCAPEALAAGHFSPESDQFSLAATLYEAVSGERAFPGDDAVGVASKIQTEEPRPIARRSNLSDDIDEILARGMSKNPRDRFASVAELGELLAAALERSVVPPARRSAPTMPIVDEPVPAALPAPAAPSGLRMVIGGVTLTVIGALVGYAASQGQPFLRMTPDLAPLVSASAHPSADPPARSTTRPKASPSPRPAPTYTATATPTATSTASHASSADAPSHSAPVDSSARPTPTGSALAP